MNYWYFSLKWILRIIFAVPLYINYKTKTRFDSSKYIFVANHISTLDPLMVMMVLPKEISILITGGVFSIPIVGRMLVKAGHIPVYDDQGRTAYEAAKQVLNKNRSILIFPEGALSHEDGSIKPLFSGAARLSMETRTPIIPIGISLSKTHWIKIKINLMKKIEYARFYLLGTYALTVGEPLNIKGSISSNLDKKQASRIITKKLINLSKESEIRIK